MAKKLRLFVVNCHKNGWIVHKAYNCWITAQSEKSNPLPCGYIPNLYMRWLSAVSYHHLSENFKFSAWQTWRTVESYRHIKVYLLFQLSNLLASRWFSLIPLKLILYLCLQNWSICCGYQKQSGRAIRLMHFQTLVYVDWGNASLQLDCFVKVKTEYVFFDILSAQFNKLSVPNYQHSFFTSTNQYFFVAKKFSQSETDNSTHMSVQLCLNEFATNVDPNVTCSTTCYQVWFNFVSEYAWSETTTQELLLQPRLVYYYESSIHLFIDLYDVCSQNSYLPIIIRI